MKLLTVCVFAGLSLAAYADEHESYNLEMSRSQVELNCQLSKNDGGTTDCQINVKAKGIHTIEMQAHKHDEQLSYNGADTIESSGSQYILAVSANAEKALQSVSMVKMTKTGENSFSANMTASAASMLMAVQVNPLEIQMIDDKTMKVNLTAIAYAPAKGEHSVSSLDNAELGAYILKQIKPALDAVRKQ